jgi:hypothetical protein
MTPEQLYNAGAALYGPRWRSAIAEPLGVSEGLVRFWLNGERRLPPGLREQLRDMLALRIAELEAALEGLGRG